jgi:hypothetical protein
MLIPLFIPYENDITSMCVQEQKKRAVTEPPPVHGDKLWPMLSSFVSYKDYLKVLTPLLLLELWTSITNESESNLSDPRSV